MKVVCEGINLSEAVLKVVKACAVRTTVPLLECIKLTAHNDGLTLSATDGEISIQKTVKAEVYEEGETCVPGRYFSDFIKKLEDVQITLAVEGGRMEIMYADSQSYLQVLSAEDFPKISTDISENSFKMAAADLKKVINATSFCCAADDSRPNLKGCQFVISDGKVCVTALDGFRLATITAPVKEASADMDITCPARTLNEIEKMLPAEGETEVFVQRGIDSRFRGRYRAHFPPLRRRLHKEGEHHPQELFHGGYGGKGRAPFEHREGGDTRAFG